MKKMFLELTREELKDALKDSPEKVKIKIFKSKPELNYTGTVLFLESKTNKNRYTSLKYIKKDQHNYKTSKYTYIYDAGKETELKYKDMFYIMYDWTVELYDGD